MKAGERVTLTFNPLKDGSPGGVLVSVRFPNGRELSGIPAGAGRVCGAGAGHVAPRGSLAGQCAAGAPRPPDVPK